MAYAKTHRVPWAPSAPGRPRVDEVVTRPRFGLRFSVCDQDGTEHRESDRNGNLSLGPVRDACSLRRGTEGPPEPSRDQRRSWRGRLRFVRSREALLHRSSVARVVHPSVPRSVSALTPAGRPSEFGVRVGRCAPSSRSTPNLVRRRP